MQFIANHTLLACLEISRTPTTLTTSLNQTAAICSLFAATSSLSLDSSAKKFPVSSSSCDLYWDIRMRCNKLTKILPILYFLDMIYIYIFIYYLSGYLDNCLFPVSRRLWYCSKISGITPQPPPTLHSPSHCTDIKGRGTTYCHDELNKKKIIWILNYILILH